MLYLFSKALQIPRIEDQPAEAQAAAALWELVARWFIRAAMTVIRRDLSRDYRVYQDALQTIRGHVEGVATARAYYTGRVELHCIFDDFTTDSALNRLLRAAAREVSRSPLLTPAVRKDAFRVVARMEDVGELRQTDLAATVERPTWYYRDAIALAKNILRCVGRTFSAGAESAWSFLIRTPELVEAGVRQTLVDRLGHVGITKTTAPIRGLNWGVHPDIVFGSGWGVADVKYKVTSGTWYRPDLYEVVAFATAFRSVEAALICFADQILPTSTIGLGDTNVSLLTWNCSVSPDLASIGLCEVTEAWLDRARGRALSIGGAKNIPAA